MNEREEDFLNFVFRLQISNKTERKNKRKKLNGEGNFQGKKVHHRKNYEETKREM